MLIGLPEGDGWMEMSVRNTSHEDLGLEYLSLFFTTCWPRKGFNSAQSNSVTFQKALSTLCLALNALLWHADSSHPTYLLPPVQ